MKRRISTLLLAAMLATTMLASCADSTDNSTTVDTTTAGGETSSVETTGAPTNEDLFGAAVSALPEHDFDGYEFEIAYRPTNYSPTWYTMDVYAKEENGDPINDAVFKRNMALEDEFNIKIAEYTVEGTQSGGNGPAAVVKTSILANEDKYDLVTDGFYYLAPLATENLFIDYYTIPGIELDNPWWDQLMVEDCSVANKLYFLTGDISMMDNQGTWATMFIKDLITDYNLDNPYELVDNGTWTIDAMAEMARAVSRDVNGDGEMKIEDDIFGMLTEGFNTYGFWAGTGERIVTKDENDLPTLSLMSERAVNAIEKIQDIQLDKVSIVETSDTLYTVLGEKRALFRFCGLATVTRGRALIEADFGIIPAPKLNEAQDKYYTTYSYTNLTAYSVPVTNSDLERTGVITEAMAELSAYSLTPAYYDTTLLGKAIRDDESEAMLELILANRNYDLGSNYNWGGSFGIFGTMFANKSSDFASSVAGIESAAIAAIDKYIETITK